MFHRLDLTGARIVLTGASSGIGRALAEELARLKAKLVLAARSREKLEELAGRLRQNDAEVRVVPTDVGDGFQRAKLIDEAVVTFGGIDVLINNAGVGASGHFRDASEARLRQVFEINFFAATELTRLALPHLERGNNPMIVNVSSVIGRRGIPAYSEYCASKFAMCGWSEALRSELTPFGVHLLLVCPGLIDTAFRDHMVEDRLESRFSRGQSMSAERCARIIVKAMRARRNEIVITASGKLLAWMNRLFPRAVDSLMLRWMAKNAPSRADK
jgi:short-subunit dehydrogenase